MCRLMFDTNVFFLDYKCIEKAIKDGNSVYVPSTVLEELDKHKSDEGTGGYNVRKSIRWMDENQDKFSFVVSDYVDMDVYDDRIINSAQKNGCKLVSNDINVRLKCKTLDIESMKYKNIEEISLGELRKGKHIIKDNMLLSEMYINKAKASKDMFENDFVLFYENEKLLDVGIVKEGNIIKAKLYDKSFSNQNARSFEQKLALTHLFNKDLDLVTFSGVFGTSKTFLMLASALQLVENGVYDRIYVIKAPISLDKNLMVGFKPGNLLEKYQYALGSVTTNLKNIQGNNKFNRMYTGMRVLEDYINKGVIEVISIEDILGMSLAEKSVVLLEEAQLLTEKVMRAVISRKNEDSVIFANGDLGQASGNNLLAEETGFFKLINCFSGYEKYAHLTLEDVQRSEFVEELAKRWK